MKLKDFNPFTIVIKKLKQKIKSGVERRNRESSLGLYKVVDLITES